MRDNEWRKTRRTGSSVAGQHRGEGDCARDCEGKQRNGLNSERKKREGEG